MEMTGVAGFYENAQSGGFRRARSIIAAGVLVACLVHVTSARASTNAGPVGGGDVRTDLPDLVPDLGNVWVDYTQVGFDGKTYSFGPSVLSFDVMTENLGRAPMNVHADDPTRTGEPRWSQCTAWTVDLLCRHRSEVQGVSWDQEHNHYRFEDFARYELRRLDAEKKPDFGDGGLLASRRKAAECFRDRTKVRDDALPAPRYAFYGVCDPVESGISPGWTDEAEAATANQDVPLDGIGDGRYALVVTIDPEHHFSEASTTNNRLVAIVEIAGKNTPFPVVTVESKSLM
jgi:hypothetical protein